MRFDAIIIGGSFAGLSAALYLGRARRSVCVLDTRKPRNRFAAASHGLFAQDGRAPMELLETMRAQVATYPTVTFVSEAAVDAMREGHEFCVTLADGRRVDGARLLLAFGITDVLPPLPGLLERWGHSVIHCPYCHAYEFGGKQLGVLFQSPMSVHQASLVREWGPTTFFLNGAELESDAAAELAKRGVAIDHSLVKSLVGEGANLSAIRFEDGREQTLDALFIGPPTKFSSPLAERLGCAIESGPFVSNVIVNEMKETNVPGVFAAGDITRKAHTTTFACADGVMAALAIHRSLVF